MDQQDIFALFDYNLAYEIRLADALESKMLTPFHYIGIRDYEIDGQTSDDFSDLRWLGAKKRVSYLLKELDYYGYSGTRPCGLVFCSRQEEARQLAEAFTQQGQPAQALTNQDSPAVRRQAVKDLESGRLHYLVTVDLFNEGVDIPALNQIVMLRATQSATVFIQQLGRGLRLYPGQDFVTVLDFIGNYQNNYLIPLALAWKKLSRDQLKYQLQTVSFAGLSTINFSRIASQEILAPWTRSSWTRSSSCGKPTRTWPAAGPGAPFAGFSPKKRPGLTPPLAGQQVPAPLRSLPGTNGPALPAVLLRKPGPLLRY